MDVGGVTDYDVYGCESSVELQYQADVRKRDQLLMHLNKGEGDAGELRKLLDEVNKKISMYAWRQQKKSN